MTPVFRQGAVAEFSGFVMCRDWRRDNWPRCLLEPDLESACTPQGTSFPLERVQWHFAYLLEVSPTTSTSGPDMQEVLRTRIYHACFSRLQMGRSPVEETRTQPSLPRLIIFRPHCHSKEREKTESLILVLYHRWVSHHISENSFWIQISREDTKHGFVIYYLTHATKVILGRS